MTPTQGLAAVCHVLTKPETGYALTGLAESGVRRVSWWHMWQPANLSLGPMGAVRPLPSRPRSAITHFHSYFGSLLVGRAAWILSSVPRDLDVALHPGPPESVTSPGQGEGDSMGLMSSGPVPLGWGSPFPSGKSLTLDPTHKMNLEVSPALCSLQEARAWLGAAGRPLTTYTCSRETLGPRIPAPRPSTQPTLVKEQESRRAMVGRGSPQAPHPTPQISLRNCHLAFSWS